ncbi:MAG: DUF1254 domain-containing protein [Halioglobus sp.]|nr:DUF1254 domain-containing protein [Halioglobus sp.]
MAAIIADPTALAPTQAAWDSYAATLREQREILLAHRVATDQRIRDQGLYALHSQEASAFAMYVEPRQQYPQFSLPVMPQPVGYSWGLPSPDFLSYIAFIDGAHNYRIYGKRSNNYWATLQLFSSFWGEGKVSVLGHVDFDEIPTGKEGAFEIFLGPNPPVDDDRYWVKLDPAAANIQLSLRETFYDWQKDQRMELHIETLDRDENAPLHFDEAELARRIDKARRFVEYNFKYMIDAIDKVMGEYQSIHEVPYLNQFQSPDSAAGQGGNPLAAYISMIYDLGPDEALVIDMPPVEARYWSFQTGTLWSQTTDFTYHQSSINGAQAVLDQDGHFRAVLSLQDPGVPNWIDPAGIPTGICVLRLYKFKQALVPTVTKVALSEVREHLPSHTPVVSLQQRSAALAARRDAVLRRYGN